MKASIDTSPRETNKFRGFEIAGALQGTINLWNDPEHGHSLDLPQKEALTAIGIAIMDKTTSGYIHMATSTGKTVVEVLLAEAALKANLRVLMLAPSITIARQLAGEDQESGIGKFTKLYDDKNTTIQQHFGNRRANSKANLTIATYSGFQRDYEGDGCLGDFDMVIADECHRSLGPKTSEALKNAYPGAIKIGFSATPDYATDRLSEEVYGTPIYEYSLKEAIENGKTAPIRPLVYETKQTINVTDYANDFTMRELAPLIDNTERNGTAIEIARQLIASGRQGIIRCVSGNGNVHAQALADLLSSYRTADNRPIVAVDIGSHLSRDEQFKRLQAFNSGEIDVLTFTRFLEEGWDSDKARFCINLVPSTSPVVVTQLLGRVLRKGIDAIDSIFVDFIDQKQGMTKRQYTALHALGIMQFDMTRVLGNRNTNHANHNPLERQPFEFDNRILDLFARSHGKPVELLGKSEKPTTVSVDPLIKEWDDKLAKEGMPPELDYNIVFDPVLIRRREIARLALLSASDIPPSEAEVIDNIKQAGLSNNQKKILGRYGVREPWELLADFTTVDYPFEGLATSQLHELLHDVLDSLSEREARVISMRFGLETGLPETYHTIGNEVGVTYERVRGIEKNAIAKLRHPSRSTVLEPFAREHRIPDTIINKRETAIHLGTGPNSLLDFLRKPKDHILIEITYLADGLPSKYTQSIEPASQAEPKMTQLCMQLGLPTTNKDGRLKSLKDTLIKVSHQRYHGDKLTSESIVAHNLIMDVLFRMIKYCEMSDVLASDTFNYQKAFLPEEVDRISNLYWPQNNQTPHL